MDDRGRELVQLLRNYHHTALDPRYADASHTFRSCIPGFNGGTNVKNYLRYERGRGVYATQEELPDTDMDWLWGLVCFREGISAGAINANGALGGRGYDLQLIHGEILDQRANTADSWMMAK